MEFGQLKVDLPDGNNLQTECSLTVNTVVHQLPPFETKMFCVSAKYRLFIKYVRYVPWPLHLKTNTKFAVTNTQQQCE